MWQIPVRCVCKWSMLANCDVVSVRGKFVKYKVCVVCVCCKCILQVCMQSGCKKVCV
jgi:hypothetical protein